MSVPPSHVSDVPPIHCHAKMNMKINAAKAVNVPLKGLWLISEIGLIGSGFPLATSLVAEIVMWAAVVLSVFSADKLGVSHNTMNLKCHYCRLKKKTAMHIFIAENEASFIIDCGTSVSMPEYQRYENIWIPDKTWPYCNIDHMRRFDNL